MLSYNMYLNFLTAGNFHFKFRRPSPFNEWKWYLISCVCLVMYFVCRVAELIVVIMTSDFVFNMLW